MKTQVSLAVFFCIFGGTYSDVVIETLNQSIPVGEDVMIYCYNSNHEPVDWAGSSEVLKDSSGQKGRYIFSSVTGKLFVDLNDIRFNVIEANGFYNLTISNVTLADEGNYMCRDGRRYGQWKSVFLHVIVVEVQATTESFQSPITSDSNVGFARIGVAVGVTVAVVAVVALTVVMVVVIILARSRRIKSNLMPTRNQPIMEQGYSITGSLTTEPIDEAQNLQSSIDNATNDIPDRQSSCIDDSCYIDGLPIELMEMVLMKLAVKLYSELQKQSTKADEMAETLVLRRYPIWQQMLERPFYRKQLRETLDYLDRPFRRHLPDYTELLCCEKDELNFFTILNGYIYVVHKPRQAKQYVLRVYHRDNYELMHRQDLPEDMQPTGIVGHRDNDSVYISDHSQRPCIWNVTPWIPGKLCELKVFYEFQGPRFSAMSFDVTAKGMLVILVKVEEVCIKTWRSELHLMNKVGKLVNNDGELVDEPIDVDNEVVNPSSVACVTHDLFAIAGLCAGSPGICLVKEDGVVISTFSDGIGCAYSMCSLRFASNREGILVADCEKRKILLLSVNGNKLAIRKLLKHNWDDCSNDAVHRGVTNERYCSHHVEGNDSDATNMETAYFVNASDQQPVVQFTDRGVDPVDSGDSKLHVVVEVTDEISECNRLLAEYDRDAVNMEASDTVELKCTDGNVKQETKGVKPVRLAYDIDDYGGCHLVVGLSNGAILVYRLS